MSKSIKAIQTLRNRFLNDASLLCGKAYGEGYLEALAHVEQAVGTYSPERKLYTALIESGEAYSERGKGLRAALEKEMPLEAFDDLIALYDQKVPLLEQSGYSYSGIAELIRDHPENRKPFIRELHTAHSATLERIQALEGQLHSARIDVALLVQSYRAANKIVNQGDESMCYELDGFFYVVAFSGEGIEVKQFKKVI